MLPLSPCLPWDNSRLVGTGGRVETVKLIAGHWHEGRRMAVEVGHHNRTSDTHMIMSRYMPCSVVYMVYIASHPTSRMIHLSDVAERRD